MAEGRLSTSEAVDTGRGAVGTGRGTRNLRGENFMCVEAEAEEGGGDCALTPPIYVCI